jgi:hypothetical protein
MGGAVIRRGGRAMVALAVVVGLLGFAFGACPRLSCPKKIRAIT